MTMKLMSKKELYCGLVTTRTVVQLDSLLTTASISSNAREVGNNGWQHDEYDEGTLGRSSFSNEDFKTTNFQVVLEP